MTIAATGFWPKQLLIVISDSEQPVVHVVLAAISAVVVPLGSTVALHRWAGNRLGSGFDRHSNRPRETTNCPHGLTTSTGNRSRSGIVSSGYRTQITVTITGYDPTASSPRTVWRPLYAVRKGLEALRGRSSFRIRLQPCTTILGDLSGCHGLANHHGIAGHDRADR